MSYGSQKVINWRQRTKAKIVMAMGGCCQICGYDRCNNALELHHLDPTQKEVGFGNLRANPKAIALVIPELKKCVLLCSNCHKEVHAGIATVPDVVFKFNETYLRSELDKNRVERGLKPIHEIT